MRKQNLIRLFHNSRRRSASVSRGSTPENDSMLKRAASSPTAGSTPTPTPAPPKIELPASDPPKPDSKHVKGNAKESEKGKK